MISFNKAGGLSNVNKKSALSSFLSAASSAFKSLTALLNKSEKSKSGYEMVKTNPKTKKDDGYSTTSSTESISSSGSSNSLSTIEGDVSLKSFPEQLKVFIESGGATKGDSLLNFEIPEMENKEDVKTFMKDMITVQKIEMKEVEINTEAYNQLDTELKFLDYLNSKQFGPEELQDYLSSTQAKIDVEKVKIYVENPEFTNMDNEKPEMAGIKDDLFSQLGVALENATLAADKLGISFDVNELTSTKVTEIMNKYKECLKEGKSSKELGDKLRKPDGKKDDFGFQKLLQDRYETTNKDITHKVASKAVKNAMKSTKGQVLDEHGMNEKYQNISQEFELDSGASIKTTTVQQTDQFVSSATHASNPNHIGNLHLETNEITVKDTKGNDKTVTKKTLRHGAINTHHLKGDAELNGFGIDLGYSASNLEELTKSIRDDLQSSDEKSVTRGQDAQKKLGISEGKVKAWNSWLNGGSIRTDLLKKKLNQKLALRNKAIDLANAAYKAAPADKKATITINSFSLLTPDTPRDIKAWFDGGHSEKQALKEQVEAYKILENMTEKERGEVFGENPPEFQVNAFNFGVNEGAEMGFSTQQAYNEDSMKNFLDQVKLDIDNMKGDPAEKTAAQNLKNEVEDSYEKYKQGRWGGTFTGKGNWRADQAYALVAKMQTLADVTSEASGDFSINAVNCASGKDRTGMSQSTSTNYFEQFHESVASAKDGETPDITKTRYEQIQQLDAEIKPLPKDSPNDKKINMKTKMEKLQKENLEFALKTNQLEIQEKNTGTKGHKLYGDSMPQLLTGNIRTKGGQTLQMQMLMYGLDKEGVEAQFTRTSKNNAT